MKKITVTLSEKAEKYFNDVRYSLDYGDGKMATHSDIINHCLEELADFEEREGQSVTGYLFDLKKDEPILLKGKELDYAIKINKIQ